MPPKRKSAFGGNSATGRKSATVQAKRTTQAPTIQRRTRKPRAMAAVHEVLNRLTTRGRSHHARLSRSPDSSPSPLHTLVDGTDRVEAVEREHASLKLSVDAVSDSLDEVKEMLQALATNFKGSLAPGQGAIQGTASSMPTYVGSVTGP